MTQQSESLAKEFFRLVQKPSVVAKLLAQDPSILQFHDSYGRNVLQAALKATVHNENSALTILNYPESHHMIKTSEEDINNCPFYLSILKGS